MTTDMRCVFVTGGSGFVGSHLIPRLIQQGYSVQALARSPRSAEKVQALGATPVLDDLTHLTANTANALQTCEAVLHVAAHMDFTYDKALFQAINVTATERLLELAQAAGVQRFIYISAAPVVPGSPIVNLTEAAAKEGLPQALYPKTKALAERAVLAANRDDFKTLALRPPAIWGPNNPHLQEMAELAHAGKWRWIGDGAQILSTIHVFNLAEAVCCALKSDRGGDAYFITDDDQRSMKETFQAMLKAHGVDPGEASIPRGMAMGMAHLVGGIWRLLGLRSRPPIAPLMIRLMGTEFSISDAKARRELGYRTVISFEEGIAQMGRGEEA